jgi:hypothetical protein
MGFVKNWQSMAALRLVLGIFEAGFFPGSVYLLRLALLILVPAPIHCSNFIIVPGMFDLKSKRDIQFSTLSVLWPLPVQAFSLSALYI